MTPIEPLHILLTNDDGIEAPGIRALHRFLNQSGHRISMVAPSSERSATGMSITTRRNIQLEQVAPDCWHMDGHPADAVLVALDHLFEGEPPDLVVSGVNFGPNLGGWMHASGTVGAALVAVLHGIPAIAVSTGIRFHERGLEPRPFPSTHLVLEPASEFTLSVIESLVSTHEPGSALLPPGVILNINYPALPREKIRGVLYPRVTSDRAVDLGYERCEESGHAVPRYRLRPEGSLEEEGDIRAHEKGFITISALRPDWNAPEEIVEDIRSRLGKLG